MFLLYGAPVILSGEATFAGYIKLDDTSTWLALTDRVMEHGHSLDGLAPKQRAAVVLRYGHDLSVAEIADILGVEPATAKTHLVRGLGRLRELMEDHL